MPEVLIEVPGLVAKRGPHGEYLTVSGPVGFVVPVLNVAEQIVGLVCRADEPLPGKKYVWLSSGNHGGPSVGSRAHVPAGVKASNKAVLVEGVLKANVVAALRHNDAEITDRTVIGLPGCHVNDEALAALRDLGVKEALLALDADARTNHHVAQAQCVGLDRLEAFGFQYGVLRWDATAGKGLDDALLTYGKARA
jgi:hypothetical protein